jgi:hypothetical protein
MRRYRGGVGFVMDVASACTSLDRNAKVRLLYACEQIELRTKRAGRRNGLFGIPAMMVLRALLLRFHGKQGICNPSYDTIQRATGLCRASVATGLARLEAAGVLKITRRLVRLVDEIGVTYVRQGSNLYGFAHPAPVVPFPRVHRLAANHKPPQIKDPFIRAIAGAITRASRGPAEKAVASEALKQLMLGRGM